ncbi:MAG: toxin-antitoxin system HicB family antitoxin [Deltaproteobacteria bacterium]|nr:toxin-antitoxin system HicB family antitoxin [Deltaproteobacteria bacterium]
MSTISIRLPESLHDGIREAARREGISINQFIASAAGEKLAAWATEEYLAARARRGDRVKFEAALLRVPDREPDPEDAI